jgi:fatty acid desaturase
MTRPEDLAVPETAWPTLGVLALALGAEAAALRAGASGLLAPSWAAALATGAAFAAFTPLHDAVHGSVSRRRWLNELCGRLAALMLGGSFAAYRRMHLTHHRYTNEPGRDPDLWSGEGPVPLLPLRWLTQVPRLYWAYGRLWSSRPAAERADFLLSTGLVVLAAAAGGGEALLFWLIPAAAAWSLLAFCFDYLPHQPHRVPASRDRYRATHALTDPFLTPLFLYQNYHLIHHLYPGVPFYRYSRIWSARRESLLAAGAREVRLGPYLSSLLRAA